MASVLTPTFDVLYYFRVHLSFSSGLQPLTPSVRLRVPLRHHLLYRLRSPPTRLASIVTPYQGNSAALTSLDTLRVEHR